MKNLLMYEQPLCKHSTYKKKFKEVGITNLIN